MNARAFIETKLLGIPETDENFVVRTRWGGLLYPINDSASLSESQQRFVEDLVESGRFSNLELATYINTCAA
jgi:GAF domain-containing protein